MTQKYKKNNSPAIQNSIFPVSPMFSKPFYRVSPMFHNPIYPIPPMFHNPIFPVSPMFFGLGMGQHVWCFKKNMGDLQVRSPIRVMWKTLVVFGDRD